jgi:hypothetical protein
MHKSALLLPALASAFALAALAAPAQARQPVVVELFTSQGCSACTKANTLLTELDDHPGVLGLTFPVDYWDYLGWRDTFAKPEFSARQRAYMTALGLREVFTPQMVVDGAAQAGRAKAGETLTEKTPAMIKAAARARLRTPPPPMRFSKGKALIGAGRAPRGGATVWLVRYAAQPQETPVKDGENRGVTVVYHNVARDLVRLGSWSGRPRAYALPAAPDGDAKTAILLQADGAGRILGVLTR